MKRTITLVAGLLAATGSFARTIHCSDNANILDYLQLEIDETSLTGKIELKSSKVDTIPERLLGIGGSSIGYVGLLTIQTPNVKCFFSKEAPEPISCWTGPNGAGNGNFSSIRVEGDTDLQIPEIDSIDVTLAKSLLVTATSTQVSYKARVSVAKYNPAGPNRTFDEFFDFRRCALRP